jgi:AcrR family transcriptional regulator
MIPAMAKAENKPLPVRLLRVLDEAAELFGQEGFLHFSTDDLARRLRCSKRTIYAVAPGREKFFEAVIFRRVATAEEATIAPMRDAPNVRAAVQGCIQASVDQAQEVNPLFMRDVMLFPAGRRAIDQWRSDIADELEHLIERGITEGLFRRIDPRVAAEALLTSVLRMCEPDFSAHSRTTTAEAVRQVYEIFWAGLFQGRHRKLSSGKTSQNHVQPAAARPKRAHSKPPQSKPANAKPPNGKLIQPAKAQLKRRRQPVSSKRALSFNEETDLAII